MINWKSWWNLKYKKKCNYRSDLIWHNKYRLLSFELTRKTCRGLNFKLSSFICDEEERGNVSNIKTQLDCKYCVPIKSNPQHHVIDIANQLLTRHSRHSVRLMNEQQSLHHSISDVVFCWNFLRLRLLKHWKIRTAYRQWRSNFNRRERKPKYVEKTESYVLSNDISRDWERKLINGIFATGRF